MTDDQADEMLDEVAREIGDVFKTRLKNVAPNSRANFMMAVSMVATMEILAEGQDDMDRVFDAMWDGLPNVLREFFKRKVRQ